MIAQLKYTVSLNGNWGALNVNAGESSRRGGQFAIELDSPEAEVLMSTLVAGLRKTGSLAWVNAIRQQCGRKPVSRWAVTRFCERLKEKEVMKRLSRGVKKSGTLDATSLWARARLAFAKQLSEWLEIRKMQLEDIIFLDEHHEKCQLGCLTSTMATAAAT